MGSGAPKNSQINVASLNYAGIAHSPFEFYSGNDEARKEMDQLSRIFIELVKREFKINEQSIPANFDWQIKNLDKKMQRQRYCPLYRQDAGISRGRLMTRGKFMEKWKEQYDKNCHYVKFNKPVSIQQEKMCQLYDYLIYKTFVQYIYNYKMPRSGPPIISHDDRDHDPTLHSRSIKQKRKQAVIEYQSFLERHFSKTYLKHEAKLAAVKEILKTKDVVFLQDVSDELINSLKNEGSVNILAPLDRDCVILLKEEKFHKLYDQRKIVNYFGQQMDAKGKLMDARRFDYTNGKCSPALCFVDNFLFISVHIHKSIQNLSKLMQHLLDLRKAYPNLHIVMGGDFNRFVKKESEPDQHLAQKFFKEFDIFPKREDYPTTQKKRTWLQSQRNKADKDDKSCRDFIITSSSLKMRSPKIEKLGEGLVGRNQLLTDRHPFDHYIISAVLTSNN